MNLSGRNLTRSLRSTGFAALLLAGVCLSFASPSAQAQTLAVPVNAHTCKAENPRIPATVCQRKFVLDVPAGWQGAETEDGAVEITRTFGLCQIAWDFSSLAAHRNSIFKKGDGPLNHMNGWAWYNTADKFFARPLTPATVAFLAGYRSSFVGELRSGKYRMWVAGFNGMNSAYPQQSCFNTDGSASADGIRAVKAWKRSTNFVARIHQP